jgi:integrase
MLTDKALRALKPRINLYEIPDRQGLSVRINPAGRIAFQFRYRFNGKPVRLKLGTYPEMSLAAARKAHSDARAMIDQGIDPAYRKKTEKMAATTAETVDDLANEFIARFINVHRKRPDEVKQMLAKDVRPSLGAYKIQDVTRRHIIKMLDGIVDRGARVKANRTTSIVKQMFQYAVNRGHIESNPCAEIRRQTIGGAEKSRDRSFNQQELAKFWNNVPLAANPNNSKAKPTTQIGQPMVIALRLLLVTVQRRGELSKAKWSDIDFSKHEWHIPSENSKNGKAHKVPLTKLAIGLFKTLKQFAGESDYVLPSPQISKKGDCPITERAITKAAERAQVVVGISKWVPHDLRRTGASWLAELGTPPHVIERIQNHTMQGVMAVYNRYDYAKECSVALELWSKYLSALPPAKTDAATSRS